jgi:hypothetical protein
MNLVQARQGVRMAALAAALGLGVTLWPALRVLREDGAAGDAGAAAGAGEPAWRVRAEALPAVDVFARAGG